MSSSQDLVFGELFFGVLQVYSSRLHSLRSQQPPPSSRPRGAAAPASSAASDSPACPWVCYGRAVEEYEFLKVPLPTQVY